jgi:hypothetical protein
MLFGKGVIGDWKAEGVLRKQGASLPRQGRLPSSYPQQVVAFLLQARVC